MASQVILVERFVLAAEAGKNVESGDIERLRNVSLFRRFTRANCTTCLLSGNLHGPFFFSKLTIQSWETRDMVLWLVSIGGVTWCTGPETPKFIYRPLYSLPYPNPRAMI